MQKFKCFNEWRGLEIYGENPEDALLRRKKLQRPDKYSGGIKCEEGEIFIIKKILTVREPKNSTRGNKPYIQCLVEMEDRQIFEVDMQVEEFDVNCGDRNKDIKVN